MSDTERDMVNRAWRKAVEMPLHSASLCSTLSVREAAQGFKLVFTLPASPAPTTAPEQSPPSSPESSG
jgi:hypothetical protein